MNNKYVNKYINNTNNNNKPNNINIYNEHYSLFCNNLNNSLKQELGLEIIDNYKYYSKIDWEPPSTYGLDNSQRIIPQHYFEQDNKSFKEIYICFMN